MSGNGGSVPKWVLGLGKALLYGFVSAVVLLALAIALSGPTQRERKATARNVAILVTETRKNRQILCLALIRNSLSTDPDVLRLCSQVGVKPQSFENPTPPTEPVEGPGTPNPAPAPSVPGESPATVTRAPTASVEPTPSLLPSPPCIPVLTCEGGNK